MLIRTILLRPNAILRSKIKEQASLLGFYDSSNQIPWRPTDPSWIIIIALKEEFPTSAHQIVEEEGCFGIINDVNGSNGQSREGP